MYIDITSKREL